MSKKGTIDQPSFGTEGGSFGGFGVDTHANLPQDGFGSTMQDMTRPYKEPPPAFPKTKIQNDSLKTGGITMSHEASSAEGAAELNVLKAILNREGYLNRVAKSARTVHKKFKPEISDILDLIRAASLDVCESVVKWREVKKDHDAAFMWNNVNYLLKMPSDLDFLVQYLAIENYLGFGLYRNPFVIPCPLEMGAHLYADLILDPKGITNVDSTTIEGTVIGGMTENKLRATYTPSAHTKAQGATRYDKQETEKAKKTNPYGVPGKGGVLKEPPKVRLGGTDTSIVLNDDLRRIRQAELVVLKEEEKFGAISRDPENRLMPILQAETRIAAVELIKDNKRPIEEPSHATKYAPHAKNSDIGTKKDAWLPSQVPPGAVEQSELLAHVDQQADGFKRGDGKFGGQLVPIETKGVDTRIRKPLRGNVGSQMEFRRFRKKKMLSDRLDEIAELRKSIEDQKAALAALDKKASRKQSRQMSMSMSSGGDGQGLMGTMSMPTTPAKGAGRPKSVSIAEDSQTSPERKMGDAGDNNGMGEDSFDNNNQQQPGVFPVSAMSQSVDGGLAAMASIMTDETKDSDAARPLTPADKRKKDVVKLDATVVRLEEEEKKITLELSHISKDEQRMLEIKEADRLLYGQERSREIERKRRLLSKAEGVRKGNPPPEAQNAYDWYAKRCQSVIRGWLARCYSRWYKQASRKASTVIQATARGKLGRMRVKKKKLQSYAQTQISKIYRGYKARGVGAAMAANKNVGKSAIKIQRVFRGYRGRKRAISKKALDAAAEVARESVDPRALLASDVRELGRRIMMAIEEPETTPFPPDEVLHLVRITTVILQQSRGVMGFSEYNFINARYYGEVDGEDMTWKQAASMLSRAERLIRLVRAMAFGPGEKPPRMIQISPQAQVLYSSQMGNPRWKLDTFEQIGLGSKFCAQLFNWIISVTEVAERQREFGSFLVSSFPDWLPQMFELEGKTRACEFNIEVASRCIEKIKETTIHMGDPALTKLCEVSIKEQDAIIDENEENFRALNADIDHLCNSQIKREDLAIVNLEDRLEEMLIETKEMTEQYLITTRLASGGDPNAKNKLPELRAQMTEHELSIKSLEAQLRILKEQVTMNHSRRSASGALPIDIRVKGTAIGEALAEKLVAIAKIGVFLAEQGVRHKEDLPDDMLHMYAFVDENKQRAHAAHYKIFVDGDGVRKAFDRKLYDQLQESQKQEMASAEKVRPSDEELEEERREDDEQAKEERLKRLQFIPDQAINHEHPERPRPTVIAIGRDLPAHSKNKIREEVTKLMPGLFVFLDHDKNMGLDILAMQSVLDAKKCIMMMVDQGQTRQSRSNFVKSFEVTLRALIPNPSVIMLVGDDKNSRGGTDHYGTEKHDLARMRDRDIKVAMEGMAWVTRQIESKEVQRVMTLRSKLVEPPSGSFVHVGEAFFCVQSQIDSIRLPDPNFIAMSWRFVSRLMGNPQKIADSLRELKRGASSLKFCQCVKEYLNNPMWPDSRSKARQDDPLLHMMALFVELFIQAERATLDCGGTPVTVLSKGSRAGIQAMEVVQDTRDPSDMIYVATSCGWRMTVAKVVKFALQDLRTMKKVMKINGTLLNVGAYREKGMIYFDTYNTATSEQHICGINKTDIPFLLMPNAETLEVEGRHAPPQDKAGLYQALALLLSFDKLNRTTAGSRKVLRCTRSYTLLRKIQTKMNGHSVFIKCFEAALAQLYFKIYMQDTGSEITFLLEERARLEILQNADPLLELQHVQDDDARKMLAVSIDRLVISPSKTMQTCAMGRLFDANAYHKKGINLNDVKAQGYKLKVRTHGGAGRKLCRKVLEFTGIPHILEVRTFTLEQLLLVTAYEPRTRATLHLNIPMYLRKILLGSSSEDHRTWIGKLTERLKINWRGNRSLYIDSTIHRSVRKVANKRMLMKVAIEDEDHAKVILVDTQISETFECVLTRKDIIELLLYEQIGDVIRKDFGVDVKKAPVRKILNEMARGPTSLPGEAPPKDDGEIDRKVFDTALIDIMSNNAHVIRLTKQLELVVSKIKKDSDYFGYHCFNPVKLEFIPPQRTKVKEGMNTELRFSSPLTQSVHTGDLIGTLRARKQYPPRHMEEELNELALQLLKAAQAKAEADRIANEEFERQLLGIAEGDAFAITNPVDLSEKDKGGVEGEGAEGKGDGEEKAEGGDEAAAVDKPAAESTTEPGEGEEKGEGDGAAAAPVVDRKLEAGKGYLGGDLTQADFEALSEEEKTAYRIEYSAAVQESIQEAARLAMDDALGSIEKGHQERAVERSQPGNTQEVRRIDEEARLKQLAENPPPADPKAPVRQIVGRHEKKVFEGGVKTTFKDTKNSWSGHVAITVYEIVSWAEEEGIGKRYKFDVYEPGTAQIYTGIIENIRHLRRILGQYGKDLEDPAKLTEMILFVGKFRMWVVDNNITWDGEVNDPDAPPYRIEFETVRVYTEEKVTPINANAEDDALANKKKLIEAQKRRGIKINRMVRRVNGVLMQLTTFEVSTSDEHRAAIRDSVDQVEGGERGIPVWEPPTLKIIGYNPRSKRKTTYIAPPAAILEVAGGIHSPYLDPKRRRELAKIAGEALALKIPKDGPPELVMAWSGSSKEFAAAASAVAKSGKVSRSSAEAVLKRTGKLFRTALVIGRVECVVTLFNQSVPSTKAGGGATGYQEKQMIVNIYSRGASEAAEIIITDAEQVERIGRTIASFPDGEIRSAAVRRLIRFIHCDVIPDMASNDPDRKVLHVVLRPPKKDFLTEYGQVKPTPPGEDIRPVGVPSVFLPLDSQGKFLYRCSRALKNLKKKEDIPLDYIITVYTKSDNEGAERGLVIKFYERDTANTCILHLGPSEMHRICADNDEHHLLKEMAVAVNKYEAEKLDQLESGFESAMSKGELKNDANKIILRLVTMCLDDIGLTLGPDQSTIPYVISKGRGNIPIL
jgi:hypothetical protein